MQSSSSSGNEDNVEETEIMFQARRAGDSSNVFSSTGPPNCVNRSAASDINAKPFLFSIFILFFRQIIQIILNETISQFKTLALQREKGGDACIRSKSKHGGHCIYPRNATSVCAY
jgi:hypothetical protein